LAQASSRRFTSRPLQLRDVTIFIASMGRICAGLAVAASCMLLAPLCVAEQPEAICRNAGTLSKDASLIQVEMHPSVHINNDWLIVNKKWYSRKRAHDAWLGRIGRTNGIWVRPVMLNFRGNSPEEWLRENVYVSTTLTLNSAQVQKITASVSAKFPAGFGGDAGISANGTHKAGYVLRGLTFEDTFKIKHWFNDNAHQEFVQDYKDMYDVVHKPRIVTTVWVMVKGDSEQGSSCTGGHLTLNYGSSQGGGSASVSGHGCVYSTWSFDPDTTIAYEASYIETENMMTIPPSGRVKDVAVDWYWTR